MRPDTLVDHWGVCVTDAVHLKYPYCSAVMFERMGCQVVRNLEFPPTAFMVTVEDMPA